ADVATTSIAALMRIGKAAIVPTIAVLRSEDKDLVEYAKAEAGRAGGAATSKEPHLSGAAIVLGAIGRAEAAEPMMDAMAKADDVTRTMIARELPRLPKTPRTVKAVQDAYLRTPVNLTLPLGQGAREALSEALVGFYDASLVPWIIKNALAAHGASSDIDPVRAAAFIAAMKLMTAADTRELEKLSQVAATGPSGRPMQTG